MEAESWILPVQLAGQMMLLVAIVHTLRWHRSTRRMPPQLDGRRREPYRWPQPAQVSPKPKTAKVDRPRTPRRIIVLGSIGVCLILVSFFLRIAV